MVLDEPQGPTGARRFEPNQDVENGVSSGPLQRRHPHTFSALTMPDRSSNDYPISTSWAHRVAGGYGRSRVRRVLIFTIISLSFVGIFISSQLLGFASLHDWDSHEMVPGWGVGGVAEVGKSQSYRAGDSLPSAFLIDRVGGVLGENLSPRWAQQAGSGRKNLGDHTPDVGDQLKQGKVYLRNEGRGEWDGGRKRCKNTVQGRVFLTDSEGNVCRRANLDPTRPGCCAVTTGQSTSPHLSSPMETSHRVTPYAPGRTVHEGSEWGGGKTERYDHVKKINADDPSAADVALQSLRMLPDILSRYSCWGCDVASSCCEVFEFCVSCCMDPSRGPERLAQLQGTNGHGGGDGKKGNGDATHAASYRITWGGAGHGDNGGGFNDESKHKSRGGKKEGEEVFDFCNFKCRTYSGSVSHENTYRGPSKHCFGWLRPPLVPGMSVNSDGLRVAALAKARWKGLPIPL
ncbi:unnamed protein product [Choristocarpus tenellus]